ncbi:MAG: DNA polymerase III subunit gamma/tau [Pseudodesulfovibrio sp.]|uniref:DNA polymerase III subunit gamma/tau n=1 Tax=Pseudodesulfovibrio aespoeensis (strain ATCC 700646 / DSM 10631 / Aspo-2) TaxID=643562 RepID=E6VW11_PSEA9|nr:MULTISPECIES: DNA polymerase III subunit gamma/tau [Pseudodesulfovibrio]MBU4191485.1 DNA polymerase III subunit gamma/tau [Pseudomonadota bacterium]ADU62456.1 DNA polymerase III, subunits gamma and tau [Pseudodesulfovibrio aespoeensis Aspo-2]MBU4244619.1 DNA polymerase III subunit gamma/tau [Pseudomonadota bacterium]MBU4377786.1 DNA polymerase III subunit gamma/tau [Pseudomonadota bacterium]MBU4476703.1 DNA polymerase III subunit gamma/tau [Pseudomonadota bacterium]
MSTSNLTAKYRPQTFAEVAGQEAIKAILSRAAEQNRIAPAYLFSGTRGVGKTTLARIFAKALNCANAPTAEPCNQCSNCRQITAGVAVDVIEIDGASNRGIDDARRLKEDIGYAPVECRYKVFIIDEAHMLTKEAFNALLKTLEEPPPRATFIMATTEPHKFPATIVSRCQHYTFKMLSQQALVEHLEKLMNAEALQYEPGALQIIAKRGAGSVRDSMSLLGQALAIGEDVLREESVRGFLGLAGQDVFFRLMEAMHARDLVAVGMVLRQVLDQGLDLGFFLRELTTCWRNMFLLRQAGPDALPLLGFSGEEASTWMDWAGKFAPAHIHACWQMTLDGQRKVMTSLEPALALELLLLNLTSLPDLINLEAMTGPMTGPVTGTGSAAGQGGGQTLPRPPLAQQPGSPPPAAGGQRFAPQPPRQAPPRQAGQPAMPQAPRQSQQGNGRDSSGNEPSGTEPSGGPDDPRPGHGASPRTMAPAAQEPAPPSYDDGPPDDSDCPDIQDVREAGVWTETGDAPSPPSALSKGPAAPVARPSGPRDWAGFLDFVAERNGQAGVRVAMLRLTEGRVGDDTLVIRCKSRMHCSQLSENTTLSALGILTREYFGPKVEVRVETGDIAVPKTDRQLQEEAENHPGVLKVMETFSAQMLSVGHRRQ